MKVASFVHKSISDARMVLEDIGFRHIKVIHFNIPRDKLFRYFDNLSGLVELVLRDEIEKCYSFINFMAYNNYEEENPILILNKYYSQFMNNSKLMNNYHKDKSNLPAKLRNLNREIESLEKIKREKFINDFLQRLNPMYTKSENLSFIPSLFCEMFITKDRVFRQIISSLL